MRVYLVAAILVVGAFFIGLANGHSHARIEHNDDVKVIKIPGKTHTRTQVVHKPLASSCRAVPAQLNKLFAIASKADAPINGVIDQLDMLYDGHIIKLTAQQTNAIQQNLAGYVRNISTSDGSYNDQLEVVQAAINQCNADS